jgi:hypothetical protein
VGLPVSIESILQHGVLIHVADAGQAKETTRSGETLLLIPEEELERRQA